MATDLPSNVVSIHSAAPFAGIKHRERPAHHAGCDHAHVDVWAGEPVLECRDCGSIVDPYVWIRSRVADWRAMQNAERFALEELRREKAALEKQVRILRGEYQNEAERRAAERAIAVLPPQRRKRA